MAILAYGINHKTAPIAIREQIAFNPEQTVTALQSLQQKPAVNEAVILSTCNRTEIYSAIDDIELLQNWMSQHHSLNSTDIAPFSYHFKGIHAVQHLMRVASGLDSMVLGEKQILGQIKKAYALACDTGMVGKKFKHLFPTVFAASKLIRNQTAIDKSPVSIAYGIVQLAKRIFSSLHRCQILLVGTGEIMELVATHLSSHAVKKIIVANRTVEKARSFANSLNADAIRIGDIPQHLAKTDIVISATASQLPIIGKGLIESTLKQQKHRPLLMIDLAIPRDIEPEVDELDDVYLYNIDDLQDIISQNQKNREDAAKQAEALIEIQALNYMRQCRVLDAGKIIQSYRSQLESMRDQELAKALKQIHNGQDPEAALHLLAHNLVNKVMHKPTVKLRDAAYNEQLDMLMLAQEIFS